MAKWYILIIFFIFLVLHVQGVTTTIDFKERYRDWDNHIYDFNAVNLESHPLYVVADNGDNWGIVRDNKTVYLPKRPWIEYQFYPERIVPKYVINNFSQINTLVTKVNTSVWYLTVPFSANYYVSVTDDLIDFGAFKRTTKVTGTDSNITCGYNELGISNCSVYYNIVPKVVNNDIRLYFNPQDFSNVVYPLFLTENTVTVDNATFWSNQDCGDGYWSAYGGGSCATPLNSTIHAILSGYWDMESTNGTTLFGINKFGRFPNSTIAGTFNGNPSINYTSGQNWGNAVLFDGVDDYVDINSGNSLKVNGTNTLSIFSHVNIYSLKDQFAISRHTSSTDARASLRIGNTNRLLIAMTLTTGFVEPLVGSVLVNNIVNFIGFTYDGSNLKTYLNDTLDSTTAETGNFNVTSETENKIGSIAGFSGFFNGSIDEVIVDSSGIPIFSNSAYSTVWNKTFLNNTAPAQHVVTAVKFNVYNLNVQNNTANISARENGTATWTQISTNYTSDTWINQTFWESTDFAVNVSGNGSSRAFVISMTYDEAHIPVDISGYVNNTLGAFVDGALVTINGDSVLSRDTYLVDNTDLCDFNMSTLLCEGTRQSGVNYTASSELQLIVFAHANVINTTADVIVNIDGVNVTYNTGRPLGGAEQSYKSAVIIVPIYSNYTVYFSNYHHYEWREYPLVHGYYNLTSGSGNQSVLVQQVGYADFTTTLNASADMMYNITLSEKDSVSEATVIDYSLVGAMLAGLLAFVLLRRKRKDDDYKYKRE